MLPHHPVCALHQSYDGDDAIHLKSQLHENVIWGEKKPNNQAHLF